MKKVFISMPMKDRKKEDIEASIKMLKDLGDVLIKEKHEYVNTIVQDTPPYLKDKDHNAIWYLGKSLEILSGCDILLTLDQVYRYNVCQTEKFVASTYHLEVIELPLYLICPDILEKDPVGESPEDDKQV